MVSRNILNTMQLNDPMTSFTGTSTTPTANTYKSMAMQQFLTTQNPRLYCQQPLNYLQGPVYLYSQINDCESAWHSDPQPYLQPPPNHLSLIDHNAQWIAAPKPKDENRSSTSQTPKHLTSRRNPNTVHFKHRCTWSGCIWSFKRLEHLKRHMITHTGERKYQCDFPGCGKRFGRSDNYAAHRKIHARRSTEMVLVDGTGVRPSGYIKTEE
ncbi:6376_t:CDS:2 [Paraglomus occultum]|uniref:6376_t:CDS:1 n=1 Tax=Paraglomus occultum TaxID=144539 RepID=A0A9N8W0P7_9GLOM|nr:6376_t:CDS:2 [Paraglomus occultum]